MTKVLFILSIVVMAVATVFAYQNNRAFASARNAKASTDRIIKNELVAVKQIAADIGRVVADIGTAQKDLDTESERLKAHQLKVSQIDSESKRTQEEFDAKGKKLEELKAQLAKLLAGCEAGDARRGPEQDQTEHRRASGPGRSEEKEVEAEQQKVTAAEREKNEIVRKIEERKKSFERNALTARVVAVNNDWGFVVIDAGQREGITPDTKLLVTRGTQTIGKLSILSVEGGRTVANVLTDSLVGGMTPAPGDRVILENLFQ